MVVDPNGPLSLAILDEQGDRAWSIFRLNDRGLQLLRSKRNPSIGMIFVPTVFTRSFGVPAVERDVQE